MTARELRDILQDCEDPTELFILVNGKAIHLESVEEDPGVIGLILCPK